MELLAIWNALLAALATWERSDDSASDCHRSDFDDTGELRGIGTRVDPNYRAFDSGAQIALNTSPGTIGEGIEDGALMTDHLCASWEQVADDGTGAMVLRAQRTPGIAFHAPANQRLGTGPDRWAWEYEIAAQAKLDADFADGFEEEEVGFNDLPVDVFAFVPASGAALKE